MTKEEFIKRFTTFMIESINVEENEISSTEFLEDLIEYAEYSGGIYYDDYPDADPEECAKDDISYWFEYVG